MSAPPGSDSRPSPKPGLVAVPVDGETVVYDPDSDVLHRLDGPASAVWSRMDGRATVPALASRIAADFGAPEETVRGDVADLTGTLWDRGLLDGSPARARPGTGQPDASASWPRLSDSPLPDSPLPEAVYRIGGYRALEHAFDVATNDADVCDYLADVLADLAAPNDGAAARYELVRLPLRAAPLRVDHGRKPVYPDRIADFSRDQRGLGRRGPGRRGGQWVVRRDGDVVLVTDWLDRALYALLWHINAETVRRSAPRYPLVHAAGATRGGAAVLLPAPPDAGKTTTVAGLVRAGFCYLTDEAVAIDPETLFALPYPKALSVNRGSWQALADLCPPHAGRVAGQWQVPARSIRPDAVAEPSPVRFVVLPSYDRGAATRIEPASRAEMLMQLADSTFVFQDAPRRNLDVLARLLDGADCYRLMIGELDIAVRLVGELVGP